MTDEQLLLAYRAEEAAEAFESLVHRYERELYSYLFRYLGDAAMADDAFQATFLQVHLKCEQFEEGRKFRPWLYTIATNQSIDAQRRNKRHRVLSLDRRASSPESEASGSLVELLEGASRKRFPTWNEKNAASGFAKRSRNCPSSFVGRSPWCITRESNIARRRRCWGFRWAP